MVFRIIYMSVVFYLFIYGTYTLAKTTAIKERYRDYDGTLIEYIEKVVLGSEKPTFRRHVSSLYSEKVYFKLSTIFGILLILVATLLVLLMLVFNDSIAVQVLEEVFDL